MSFAKRQATSSKQQGRGKARRGKRKLLLLVSFGIVFCQTASNKQQAARQRQDKTRRQASQQTDKPASATHVFFFYVCIVLSHARTGSCVKRVFSLIREAGLDEKVCWNRKLYIARKSWTEFVADGSWFYFAEKVGLFVRTDWTD